jgi:hypothetical protein
MAPEPPVSSHRGWDFKKQGKKRYTGLQLGMELSLAANLVLNWVCPVIYFPERLQTITAAMCHVFINVLEPSPFDPESQYFIPLFNKISWLCRQQPGRDEASNEGCNSGPAGHDFTDNSNVHQDKWAICLKVEMKDKLLIPKLDSLLKHTSRHKIQSSWPLDRINFFSSIPKANMCKMS